jgi:hypothetical protein
MKMVQTLRLVVISVPLPIVKLLELVTCSHLVSVLLKVLELVGGPVLDDVGSRVDGQFGLGVLLRLDGPHNLVLLSSLHVNVLEEVDGWRRSRRLCPRTCWGSILRAQVLVASSLLTLGLLGSLHFNVVLDNVGPRGLGGFGFNLGNFVLDSSFTFHFRVHN